MDRRCLIVVALVVGAGCNSVPFGGSTPAVEETVTPVPVTDGGSAPTATASMSGQLPPGVDANGSVNVTVLRRAHAEAVAGQSYTWTVDYDTASETTEITGRQFTREVRVGTDAFVVSQHSPVEPNRTMYVGDDGAFLRTEFENGTSEVDAVTRSSHEAYVFAGGAVAQFLRGITFDVTTVERDGRTFYRLYSTGEAPETAGGERWSPVTDYTATAYVAPSGLVRTLAVDYDRGSDGMRRHVSIRFDYTAVGETTVTPPGWIEEATPTPPTDGEPTEAGPTASEETTTTETTATETTTGSPAAAETAGTPATETDTPAGTAATGAA